MNVRSDPNTLVRRRCGRPATFAALGVIAFVGSGCQSASLLSSLSSNLTDNLPSFSSASAPQPAATPAPKSEDDFRREAETLGERYRANPNDVQAAIAYAQALRSSGQRNQATSVLEQASLQRPRNKALLGAYGRALCRRRQVRTGARSARPRAFARPAGLAHSVRAGCRARSARPPCRSAALLRKRSQDQTGRPIGAVQSWPVLRARQGPQERGVDAAARRPPCPAPIRACGRTSPSWSAFKDVSPKPRASRRPTCHRIRPPRTSHICGRCSPSRKGARDPACEVKNSAPLYSLVPRGTGIHDVVRVQRRNRRVCKARTCPRVRTVAAPRCGRRNDGQRAQRHRPAAFGTFRPDRPT